MSEVTWDMSEVTWDMSEVTILSEVRDFGQNCDFGHVPGDAPPGHYSPSTAPGGPWKRLPLISSTAPGLPRAARGGAWRIVAARPRVARGGA